MAHDAVSEIEIDGVGIVRPLDAMQIRKLLRVRGADKTIAGAAFAAGMTVARYKKLPAAKQAEVLQAYMRLTAPDNCPAPSAGKEVRKPSLRDFSYAERIALGSRLIAIKAQLPLGHFGLWCEEKSGLNRHTIRTCMRMAAKPEK